MENPKKTNVWLPADPPKERKIAKIELQNYKDTETQPPDNKKRPQNWQNELQTKQPMGKESGKIINTIQGVPNGLHLQAWRFDCCPVLNGRKFVRNWSFIYPGFKKKQTKAGNNKQGHFGAILCKKPDGTTQQKISFQTLQPDKGKIITTGKLGKTTRTYGKTVRRTIRPGGPFVGRNGRKADASWIR